MPPVPPRLARQRTALFLAVATCWVVLSDQIAFSLPLQAADQHLVQTFKGLVFALLLAPLLASSIIDMARRLKIQTVAEGVETVLQRAILEATGCHHAQGWLVCKALPVSEFFRRQSRHFACMAA